MTKGKNDGEVFLEAEERTQIDGWHKRLDQGREIALSTMEREIERAVTEQAALEVACKEAVTDCHTALDRLLRRAERAVEQLPKPVGVFVTDAERAAAYRAVVALLSDMEGDVSRIEHAQVRLLAVNERQGTVLASMLDLGASLDALCRAAWEQGLEDGRLVKWRRMLDAADAEHAALARRLASESARMTVLLCELLPKFGAQVSKNADFAGHGASCNPRAVRQTVLELISTLGCENES